MGENGEAEDERIFRFMSIIESGGLNVKDYKVMGRFVAWDKWDLQTFSASKRRNQQLTYRHALRRSRY